MPRQPKSPTSIPADEIRGDAPLVVNGQTEPRKVLCKTVQLGLGLELIGSKMSVQSKEAELEVVPMGIKMTSKKSKRVILLPWANIKGCELLSE